jgi:hypothetical protein
MSDQDPATEQWRKAMERSTGARLREVLEANDALAKELGRCVIEVERLRAELKRANDAGLRLVGENRHLRSELSKARGADYHLTDQGLAALAEPTDKEQP